MATELEDILDAMVVGLATVPNLSAKRVSKNDWRFVEEPYSVMVSPAFSGSQRQESMGGGIGDWRQVHRITATLSVKNSNIPDLLAEAQAMVAYITGYFRAHDDLGLADVLTCHEAPLTWGTSNTLIDDGSGIARRNIDFNITVAVLV